MTSADCMLSPVSSVQGSKNVPALEGGETRLESGPGHPAMVHGAAPSSSTRAGESGVRGQSRAPSPSSEAGRGPGACPGVTWAPSSLLPAPSSLRAVELIRNRTLNSLSRSHWHLFKLKNTMQASLEGESAPQGFPASAAGLGDGVAGGTRGRGGRPASRDYA